MTVIKRNVATGEEEVVRGHRESSKTDFSRTGISGTHVSWNKDVEPLVKKLQAGSRPGLKVKRYPLEKGGKIYVATENEERLFKTTQIAVVWMNLRGYVEGMRAAIADVERRVDDKLVAVDIPNNLQQQVDKDFELIQALRDELAQRPTQAELIQELTTAWVRGNSNLISEWTTKLLDAARAGQCSLHPDVAAELIHSNNGDIVSEILKRYIGIIQWIKFQEYEAKTKDMINNV